MTDKYVLENGKPVREPDLSKWARWFESANKERMVEKTLIKRTANSNDDVEVSTVFLGLDHQWGDGPPLIYETLVFGGPHDGQTSRYSKIEEAIAGHKEMVRQIGEEA